MSEKVALERLAAGALLPVETPLPDDARVDRVGARVYQHPALGGRPVVHLVAEQLSAGMDAEMGARGFGLEHHLPDLAVQERRAAGFPAWVMIHEPEHAREALRVAQALRKAGEKARIKPGHARDAFKELATELSGHPRWMPAYWEETGRIFIEHGNLAMASQSFEKARSSERELGLPASIEASVEVWEEFAAAGALPVKSLQSLATEAARQLGGEGAFRLYRRLLLRRTAAGIPPSASLIKDLGKVAKAAGRKPEVEQGELVADMLYLSGMRKAPLELWKGLSTGLVERARADRPLRALLLTLFPEPAQQEMGWWLELLEQTGALEGIQPGASPDLRPAGGLAAWFGRLFLLLDRPWPDRALELLRSSGPALREEGRPIPLHSDDEGGQLDLDAVDLCLELGLPLQFKAEACSFALESWAEAKTGSAGPRPRDPVSVLRHPELAPRLKEAVIAAMGKDSVQAASAALPYFVAVRREWLLGHLERFGGAALPAFGELFGQLQARSISSLMGENPDQREVFEGLQVASALARSLRGGIFDELCWPAWEAAWTELSQNEAEVKSVRSGSTVLLHNETRLIALCGDGQRLDIDLRLPDGARFVGAALVGDRFLLLYRDASWQQKAVWAHRPKGEMDAPQLHVLEHGAVQLADGRWTFGGLPFALGESPITFPSERWMGDGALYWDTDEEGRLVPVDPETGRPGAPTRPSWLPEGMRPERVWPPPRPGAAPLLWLGADRGKAGARWQDGDGRAWSGTLLAGDEELEPEAVVDLPGAPGRGLCESSGWGKDRKVVVADPADQHATDMGRSGDLLSGAWPEVPDLGFAHCFQVRDERGSLALREVSDEQAQALLTAAAAWAAARPEELDFEKHDPQPLLAQVRHILPQISDMGLARAVARQALIALDIEEELAAAQGRAEKAVGDDEEDDEDAPLTSAHISAALSGWMDRLWGSYDNGRALERIAAALGSAHSPETRLCPHAPKDALKLELPLERWVGRFCGLIFPLLAVGRPEDRQETACRLLERLASSPLAALSQARSIKLDFDKEHSTFLRRDPYCTESAPEDWDIHEAWIHVDQSGSTYLVRRMGWSQKRPIQVTALEIAGPGGFHTPPEARLLEERRIPAFDHRQTLAEAARLLRERGRLPWQPAAAAHLAERTGMSEVEARLIWAGLPNVQNYRGDWVGKELRERLGIKQAEAKVYHRPLRALDKDLLIDVFAEGLPQDLAQLWDQPERAAAAVAEAWVARCGHRAPVPSELLVAASRELSGHVEPAELLGALSSPRTAAALQKSVAWEIDLDGSPRRVAAGGRVTEEEDEEQGSAEFDVSWARALLEAIPWLAMQLPVGDELLGRLGPALEAGRSRLLDPGFLVDLGSWYGGDERTSKAQRAFLAGMGGAPFQTAPDEEGQRKTGQHSQGLYILLEEDEVHAVVKPCELVDSPALRALATETSMEQEIQAIFLLKGEGAGAWLHRLQTSPLTAGQHECDPRAVASEQVTAAAARFNLSMEAAALWLIHLALPTAHARNAQSWLGLTAARVKKLYAELLARELMVEGKRARAGRDHFLPGAWVSLGAPDLPLEAWKLPLYSCSLDKEHQLVSPLGRVVALHPPHILFARAWDRIQAGDLPR